MNKKIIVGSVLTSVITPSLYYIGKSFINGSRYAFNYAETVDRIPLKNKIKLENDGFYSITKNDSTPFRVMQITDLHIGGGYLSRYEDMLALKIMKRAIFNEKPDLIVITGDLVCSKTQATGSKNNLNSLKIIVEMLEKISIPYTITYGNHDSETKSLYTRKELTEYLMSQPHCLMSINNETKNLTGFSNYYVKLRNENGTINSIIFMLDSNEYIKFGRKKTYDYIHDDQVKWYEDTVLKINSNEGRVVPSYVFMHIPVKEYKEAWNDAINAKKNAVYYYGSKDEQVSCSKYDSKLFETALKLGSTKGIFCGHDHLNDFSVEYKGIRLTYGQGIDCILYAKNLFEHKGATLLKINQNGEFSIRGMKYRRN